MFQAREIRVKQNIKRTLRRLLSMACRMLCGLCEGGVCGP
jgi:hypothetical protein